MIETQQSISEWATATFGTVGSNASCAARALKECAELIMKLATDPAHPGALEECADIAICLMRLAERGGLKMREQAVHITPRGRDTALEDAVQILVELTHTLAFLAGYDNSCMAWPYVVATYACTARLARVLDREFRVPFDASLGDAIDAKMVVNRARKWRLTGDGHGQHIEDVPEGVPELSARRIAVAEALGDVLEELIEEGVARDPAFRAKVDAAEQRRDEARHLAGMMPEAFRDRFTEDEWEDLRHDLERLQREIAAYKAGPG